MTNKLLYLSYKDVKSVNLSMADIIKVVEQGFMEMGNGKVEMPPKPGVHPGDGDGSFIHAMPAYIPGMNSAGVKWVSAYPDNPAKGLPYINGLLIYNDTQTGFPLAVMDCKWITAVRTAAASAVSAKYLARADASKIGILACGVQGHTHLEAMNVLFSLKKVTAFDTNPEQAEKLAEYGQNSLNLDVEIVSDPKKAVTGCDIVVTSGPILKKPHETIRSDWVDKGTFVSCVDFDSFFSRNALNQADKWTTDNLEQYSHYKDNVGFFKDCPEVYADLGELVTGRKKGRQRDEERNFAANLGLAMEDMAVCPLIYHLAKKKNMGTWLAL